MTTENERIIIIEDNLLVGHLIGNPKKRVHTCRFCQRTFSWYEPIEHDEFCPITLMKNIRKEKGIPSAFARQLAKY